MALPVAFSQGLPQEAVTTLNDYAGGSDIVYSGVAKGRQNEFTLTGATVSKANPAVVSYTGHGLATDNGVTISGATGDWAAMNGERAITVINDDTFSVAVNSAAFSGDFDGTITTTAPRTGAAVWCITKNYYSGTSGVRSAFANGSPAANQIWANRASLKYQ